MKAVTHHCEPDISEAMTWWSELPAKWTPVGWKEHLFRFNVLYNGMVSAIPDLNPRTQEWKGFGMQLGVWPSIRAEFPGHVTSPQDNGTVLQGWNDREAPVLWSEWAQEGLLLRQEIFGYVPGGAAAERGDEPLFAWMRLSIHDEISALPRPEEYFFNLLINAPYISTGAMSIRYNIAVERGKSQYPRPLSASSARYHPEKGLSILEPDGRVRLALAPGQDCEALVQPGTPSPQDFLISLKLPARKRSHVDVLIPMLPEDPDLCHQVAAQGYDASLREAEAFWTGQKPGSAAVFQTPEAHINETLRQNIKLTSIIAERDPGTGFTSLLTGSWAYADLWATPGCMQCVMLLDSMGYHSDAERYLEMYLQDQGNVLPVGDAYYPHPGSLGPPRSIAACEWTSDHGAILWGLASHALITEDPAYLGRSVDPIIRACEYIRDMRRVTGHGGIEGLMPPGVATDQPTQIQAVWSDAWNYRGLKTAVTLLQHVGHPRAEEFAAEAGDYRRVFVEAFRAKAAELPEWQDEEGNSHRLTPMALYGEQDFEVRNAFYLDTGPLVLVFAGLMEADDPLMRSTLKWFREGPPRRVYRYDSDCWQVPSLHREMSSCEPCFSWNLFHSHQLKDRRHFIEGMYSLFTGSVSRQTYTICETRGGVTGVTGATIMAWMARLAAVDDVVEDGVLHLLRLLPLSWLSRQEDTLFQRLPTRYGPLSLKLRLQDAEVLNIQYQPPSRRAPQKTMLHIPPLPGLCRVVLNGQDLDWDGTSEFIQIQLPNQM